MIGGAGGGGGKPKLKVPTDLTAFLYPNRRRHVR